MLALDVGTVRVEKGGNVRVVGTGRVENVGSVKVVGLSMPVLAVSLHGNGASVPLGEYEPWPVCSWILVFVLVFVFLVLVPAELVPIGPSDDVKLRIGRLAEKVRLGSVGRGVSVL